MFSTNLPNQTLSAFMNLNSVPIAVLDTFEGHDITFLAILMFRYPVRANVYGSKQKYQSF